MKCLCVRQPWAWAIATGLKKIENRTWTVSYRGDLAIHASRSLDEFRRDFSRMLPDLPPVGELSFGAIVAVVRLVDIVEAREVLGKPFAEPGGLCWLLDDVRPIWPIPWVGRLSLFEVPDRMIVGALEAAEAVRERGRVGMRVG